MSERFHVNSSLGLGPMEIDGPEARHLATVMRLRPGDEIVLFNGDGYEYRARIDDVGRRETSVTIVAVDAPSRERPGQFIVAAPLPKGDRAQFLVEKLTELGVGVFVPLSTSRSVVHPRETKLDKLHRYVVEASKQCGRNVLMQVEPPMEWATFLRREDLPRLRVLAHRGGSAFDRVSLSEDVAIAVGPEGGFETGEVDAATEAGWKSVDLGPRVLRIETAALALAALCSIESR